MNNKATKTNSHGFTVREDSSIGEKYFYTRHSSGLDIYVFPKKLTTYYAVLGTRYGSIHNRFRRDGDSEFIEVPDGIAHFLEHKMFDKGDGVDTFERFSKTGASANAFTYFNMTAYLYSCTSNFYDSLEILLDYVTKPYFTEQTVQKEQGIIAQEIRMGEDNPGRALLFGMLGAIYEKNSVRIDIAGTVDSIAKINADLLYRCYETFYNLGNMALCVCGDIECEKVLETADKILGTEPRRAFRVESVQEPEPRGVYKKRFTRHMQVAQPLFAIGFKDCDIPDDPKERMKRDQALGLISDMLFSKSGSFYNELYAEGLLNPDFGTWGGNEESYSFKSIDGESRDPEAVYRRLMEYIDRLHRDGLCREDFERFLRVAYSEYIKSFDSTSEIAEKSLSDIMKGYDPFDWPEVIRSIDFDYVTKVFGQVFRDENAAMATVLPLDDKTKSES